MSNPGRVARVVLLSALFCCGVFACDDDVPADDETNNETPSAPDPDPASAEVDACVEQTVAAAKQLGSVLKTRLVEAMADGPGAAARVCATEAQQIHARVAEQTGVRVGRSSSKLRNPQNEAPEWVASYLAEHADEAGAAIPGRRGVRRTDQGTDAHVILPLVTGGLCLHCHGEVLAEDVRAVLGEHYPEDHATGYAAGDLRGVIWAEKSCL